PDHKSIIQLRTWSLRTFLFSLRHFVCIHGEVILRTLTEVTGAGYFEGIGNVNYEESARKIFHVSLILASDSDCMPLHALFAISHRLASGTASTGRCRS